MAVWYSLQSFCIFFPVLVCLDQEKSGNPVCGCSARHPKNHAVINFGRIGVIDVYYGGQSAKVGTGVTYLGSRSTFLLQN
jgi:hypothetical protein